MLLYFCTVQRTNIKYDLQQNESVELKKQLVQERSMEKILAESAKELQGNVKSLDMEVKRYRDLRHSLHLIIDPMKVCYFVLLLLF